jgi:hypothetical protein
METVILTLLCQLSLYVLDGASIVSHPAEEDGDLTFHADV